MVWVYGSCVVGGLLVFLSDWLWWLVMSIVGIFENLWLELIFDVDVLLGFG